MEVYKCKYCNKEFNNINILRGHITHCRLNPNYERNLRNCNNFKEYDHSKLEYNQSKDCYCQYCNKLCKSENSLKQHEIRCKENPNKIKTISNFIKYNEEVKNHLRNGSNQYIKAKKENRIIVISDETRLKLSNINKGKHHTKEEKEHLSKVMSSDIVQEKMIKTKKENNSFIKSSLEDESYLILKEKYPNIIRQYRSKEYPYNCDFYIPSLNLYIECNYSWTHGKKPYEGTNIDLIKLNKWKNKIKKYYKNAIYTWTDLDIRKRNIAKENNLNWIEFFYLQDLKEWINNL